MPRKRTNTYSGTLLEKLNPSLAADLEKHYGKSAGLQEIADVRRYLNESGVSIENVFAASRLERQALRASADFKPAELREQITAQLTRPDGTVAPTPAEWCTTNGLDSAAFAQALAEEAHQLFEEWFKEGRELIERAQAILAGKGKRKRKERALLPDHTALPQKLIEAGYRPGVAVNQLKAFNSRALDLFGDYETQQRTKALLESPEISAPQLGKLTPPQVRTLLGVYRLATVGNGDERLRSGFTVPASLMWKALNLVGSVSDAQRRTHFAALYDMSQFRLRWTAIITQEGGGVAVLGGECAPFEVRPIWSDKEDGRRSYTAKECKDIAKEWTENSGPWKGPLPDAFIVTIPDDMRPLDKRLVLSGNLLEKLESGARAVRGPTETFMPIDWTLWITITQTVQRPHKGRAFVDVAQVLASVYEAEKVAAHRRKGKLRGPSGYLTQYEKAVRVLEAAGLARREKQDYATTKGARRDVFEILEGNVLTKPELEAGRSRSGLPVNPPEEMLLGLEAESVK